MNPSSTGTVLAERDQDAIYQGDKLVGRVVGAEINRAEKEIRFAEIHNSDYLMLPDECQFREYRILVRTVEDATKVSRESPQKGRILRDVVAEILGYREQ